MIFILQNCFSPTPAMHILKLPVPGFLSQESFPTPVAPTAVQHSVPLFKAFCNETGLLCGVATRVVPVPIMRTRAFCLKSL